MIQEINISDIATYKNPVVIQPPKINFFYGSNGSGKTTLSNLIGGFVSSSSCTIKWKDERELSVQCYNRRFVEENFGETDELNGIFTLGKESKEIQEYIYTERQKLDQNISNISSHKRSLRTLEEQLASLENDVDDKCWGVQQEYGEMFAKALVGFRNKKRNFRNQCLKVHKAKAGKQSSSLAELQNLYNAVFNKEITQYAAYNIIDNSTIEILEENDLLNKRITGSADAQIGRFIEYLNNSDWVKHGLQYVDKAEGRCPFCHQELSHDLQEDIQTFFDEQYEKDCESLKSCKKQYETALASIMGDLNNILASPIPFLDYSLLSAEIDKISLLTQANIKLIQDKINSPATDIKLQTLLDSINQINKVLIALNADINKNNDLVKNQNSEKIRCTNMIWSFFVARLESSLDSYIKTHDGILSGIKNVKELIIQLDQTHLEAKERINKKEEELTSITPTITAINHILNRFGFNGFLLAENPERKGTYCIIRPDGSNAKKTLSEGEYNFIAFLYFYHLVYGSHEKVGIVKDKIVGIDDPISSLDSNVLLIISTLVKTFITD